MWNLFKPIFFAFPPERIHYITLHALQALLRVPILKNVFPALGKGKDDLQPLSFLGLEFPNPIGLAAGFDKDARFFREMSHLGFGHVEIGTVTPMPQEGNPQPRLFRLPKDEALINRMGFNNQGVEACVERLKRFKKPKHLILGGNIGKNKWTPNEEAYLDYEICFKALFPYVDYFVVNVSSPNTPNLRDLQEKEPLTQLLKHILDLNEAMEHPKPILLKIAPDVTEGQLEDIADIVKQLALPGIIVSNTTIDRNGLETKKEVVEAIGNGGLSGAPVFEKSTDVLRRIRKLLGKETVIIGVGGINSPKRAKAKLEAGADLIQLYSGMIYEGPGLIRRILKSLH
jgi:dihydroorotate dehydrogenase